MLITSPLAVSQQTRLVNYLDARFLDISRAFKKRFEPSTSLPTVSAYLSAVQPLLSLILQIPPAGSSATLRSTLLLRLTGDFFECVTGYPLSGLPPTDPVSTVHLSTEATLLQLLDLVTEFDQGWAAVLTSQLWDPDNHSPIPLQSPTNPISQTDSTRLKSIIAQGLPSFNNWLNSGQVAMDSETREGFEASFWRTLDLLQH